MGTFLFDSTVFGPVYSRRLGSSLGLNLLPDNKKLCNFNCIYCECGLTPRNSNNGNSLPERAVVKRLLEKRLSDPASEREKIDSITFAGNGEPTMHPEFPGILDDVLEIRKKFLPEAKIAVLSNGTLTGHDDIFQALLKTDLNILKMDSFNEATRKIVNCPLTPVSNEQLLKQYKRFRGKLIIQTLFFRGLYKGLYVDNTAPDELEALTDAYGEIKPERIMIYTIARDTPYPGLQKVNEKDLRSIAEIIGKRGIKTLISA